MRPEPVERFQLAGLFLFRDPGEADEGRESNERQADRFRREPRVVAAVVSLPPARGETLEDKVDRMEHELQELKDELKKQREAAPVPPAAPAAPAAAEVAAPAAEPSGEKEPFYRSVLDRVKLGGYGSTRFEHNSLDGIHDTFTLRRVVLSVDANIAPRLRSRHRGGVRALPPARGGEDPRAAPTEGCAPSRRSRRRTGRRSRSSRLAQFDLWDWLRLRGGRYSSRSAASTSTTTTTAGTCRAARSSTAAPRFSPPRRVGTSSAPGSTATSSSRTLCCGNYQLYVVNGVNLDTEIEQVAESRVGAHDVERHRGQGVAVQRDLRASTPRTPRR